MNDTDFDRHIVKQANGCWLWTGALSFNGYGLLRISGHTHRAHRIAWLLYRGEIPSGMCVLHTCDVRHCLNPDHLFLGTRKDNYHDALRKGRVTNKRTLKNRGFMTGPALSEGERL